MNRVELKEQIKALGISNVFVFEEDLCNEGKTNFTSIVNGEEITFTLHVLRTGIWHLLCNLDENNSHGITDWSQQYGQPSENVDLDNVYGMLKLWNESNPDSNLIVLIDFQEGNDKLHIIDLDKIMEVHSADTDYLEIHESSISIMTLNSDSHLHYIMCQNIRSMGNSNSPRFLHLNYLHLMKSEILERDVV